jgi:hypothetical protein
MLYILLLTLTRTALVGSSSAFISLHVWHRVFFCGEFSPPGDKKKRAGESNKGIFENVFFLIHHISRKKKLEVARFRQCVPLRRQN